MNHTRLPLDFVSLTAPERLLLTQQAVDSVLAEPAPCAYLAPDRRPGTP